eukprot:Sspe_Gene.2484::Locus_823_Transcript_2_2_Confidence_0.667_Length_2008::g.2484::m.2484
MESGHVVFVVLMAAVGALAGCETNSAYTKLTQADFVRGTYQIKSGGRYCLTEDVSFNPNSLEWLRANRNPMASAYESSDVLPEQYTFAGGEYDPSAYGIGFFAAIAISANGVVLDLNGHTLEQSKEHALQQRFFSLIELADRPFRGGQGPHSFGGLVAGKQVTVKNGKLGRSSHHAIHGNDNENVLLANLVMDGWEVAAVALNSVTGLVVRDVVAKSRMGVPVLGSFSAARFLRPYLNCVADEGDFALEIAGQTTNATTIRNELRASMEKVFLDVVQGAGMIDPSRHPHEYALFHNEFGVVDGNAYGFLINGLGVAVNGFPVAPAANASTDVVFSRVRVTRLQAAINEIPALSTANGAGVQTDAVGAVFQVFNRHPKTWVPVTMTTDDAEWARYKGNVLANGQAVVAKAVLAGFFSTSSAPRHSCRNTLDVSRLSITRETLDWVEGRTPALQGVLGKLPNTGVVCNTDTMFHVNKGVVGFKMDAGHHVTMRNVEASNLINFGAKGNSKLCAYSATDKSHPAATLDGYNGADVRGFSFSGSEKVRVWRASVTNAEAAWGSVVGYDVHGGSTDIECWMCNAMHLKAGSRATSHDDFTGPNRIPVADCHRMVHNTRNVSYLWSSCGDVIAPTS